MASAPTGDQRPDQRVVLVADLNGAPLTVLSVLEELLADLAAWEESDAVDLPETREALRLPAPLAGGVALAAVGRLKVALQLTQCLGCERGRLLGPDGSHAHTPLSVLILRSADIDILAATARTLGRPGLEPDLVDVLTTYADRYADQLAGRHTGGPGRVRRRHRRPGRTTGPGAHRGHPAARRPPGGQPTRPGPRPDRRRRGRLHLHPRPDDSHVEPDMARS